ncbi:hypothetical protein LZL87_008961 [Fusarium oxysporum]|nr:hypothetical protein LZL87_008961 [Fusarium oxysporum]
MSPENADPLAGLDSVDWSQLSHAYGPADDVPRLLKDLQSTDPEVYKRAFDKCWSNIYHQGSRYSASVEAVPFLYAALDSSATKDRESLLHLITSLAIASMRANAAHALAFFPRQSAASRVALLDRLSGETNNNVSATIVLALAVLFARGDDDSEKRDLINKIQEYHGASPVREASNDIVKWSCAAALFILGSRENGLAETVHRGRVDKADVDKLESTLDQDSWFPFASLNLRDPSKSVLEE